MMLSRTNEKRVIRYNLDVWLWKLDHIACWVDYKCPLFVVGSE